ncbi:Uncharacterised protein [Shigella sonnei]|nr:Uncharacterised protein [Shigella sonnei]
MVTRRVVRCNNTTFSVCSSKAMRLLTNAGETPSSSATAAKPARRATSIKTRKSFSSGKLFMIRVLCFTSYGD